MNTATVLNLDTGDVSTYSDVTAVQALLLEYYRDNATEDEEYALQGSIIDGKPMLLLATRLGVDTSMVGNASLGPYIASTI